MSSYCEYIDCNCKYCEEGNCVFPFQGSGYPYDAPCFGYEKEDDDEKNEIVHSRDDEPSYIFCNADTKEEITKRSGDDMPPDEVFVVADIIPYGFCAVVTKADFLGWLFNRDSDHDVWTVPEENPYA